MPVLRARVKHEILRWAREKSGYSLESAAKKIGGVTAEGLSEWESGSAQPTIKQLRRAAKAYHYSLAVFYLAEPPGNTFQPIRDYRRFDGAPAQNLSPQLTLAIKDAYDRRESALELFELLEERPTSFTFQTDLSQDPERVAATLREYIGISTAEQVRWKYPGTAFAEVRSKLEALGTLVFQVQRIKVEEFRGFTIASFPLPTIVVNRADALAGRLFTMLHETTHIGLRTAGVCNVIQEEPASANQGDIEVFCNRVAAAALVPRDLFLAYPKIRVRRPARWELDDLQPIAEAFAVSRDVIARRLLTFSIIGQPEYERLARELKEEFEKRPRGKARISPAVNVVSLGGRVFPSLVLEAFGRDRISASTVASYLGVQLKHLEKLRRALVTVG